MNLPNKLTVLRVALVPVFLFFLLSGGIYANYLLAALVFALAALTDALDGHIARSRGLITTFGKFMDPLADKILVASAMIAFVELGMAPSWVVVAIIAREFLVTSLRLVAASENIVIAADIWGKLKTVSQMVWILAALLLRGITCTTCVPLDTFNAAAFAVDVLMYLTLALTVASGINYIVKNRACIREMK